MKRTAPGMLAAAALLLVSACAEFAGPSQNPLLDSAFSSVLLGFNNVESSFAGGPDGGLFAWMPGPGLRGGGGMFGGRGSGPRGEGSGMCGGGLGGHFIGGLGFGRGFGTFRAFDDCAFEAASGRVVCEADTRNGLTINRSARFTTASGAVQQAYDSLTTNTANVRTSVSGTAERRNGATSTVEHASDRTISGLAAGSTQRTVNGTSAGRETTTGTNDTGNFTAVRVMGDTTTNVVVPVGTEPYPISGTIVRSMQVTLTYEGQAAQSSSRREVITYDGSDTAKVTITRDGVTQTCTLPLPRGRLTCSS